ncbi:MAG TPA: SRPBCC family protein [Actinophytocola sp.]|uniref:SRPBCC family protein n=1 Tax=Actinophytocola sp. TaxID=1872138 RepID=UPI002DBF0643|nr:SRPBCC family protein [Actinophytocola sp.]HEU5475922.1 SRPBCC family protein [Actinophytocola sp.]
MIDIVNQINEVRRSVGTSDRAEGAHTVLLRRHYNADVADVWDACTSAERISRWFLPISGELKLGGRYQLKGNAGGEILRCEPPRLLRVTWVMTEDDPLSEVEVRLSEAGSGTDLELEHVAVPPPDMWNQFGPGAVGVGWDGALLGLGLHLAGGAIDNPEEWQISPEGKKFSTLSSEAWGAAHQSAGADPTIVATNIAQTTAFYTGDPAPN